MDSRAFTLAMLLALGSVVPLNLISHADEKGEKREEKGGDEEKLTGTWVIVSQAWNGEEVDPAEIKKEELKIVIKKDELAIISGKDTRSKSTWVIDSAKRPKQITLTYIEPVKGEKSLGIYELDGDMLKLCIGPADKDLPTKFEAKRGSGYVLHVMRRDEKK